MSCLLSLEPLEDRLLLSSYSKSDDAKYLKRALEALPRPLAAKQASQPPRAAAPSPALPSSPRIVPPALPELKIIFPPPFLSLESMMIIWDVDLVSPSTGDPLRDAYNLSRGASGTDPRTKRIVPTALRPMPIPGPLDMKDAPPLPVKKEESMIIDFSNPSLMEDMVNFPDWAFPTQPTHSEQIKETVLITGSSSTGASITGTADQKE